MGNSESARPSAEPVKQAYPTPAQALVMRLDLELSQHGFAVFLGTTKSCVQSWEKGTRKMPRGYALLARVASSADAYHEMVASLPAPNAKMVASLIAHGRTPRLRKKKS